MQLRPSHSRPVLSTQNTLLLIQKTKVMKRTWQTLKRSRLVNSLDNFCYSLLGQTAHNLFVWLLQWTHATQVLPHHLSGSEVIIRVAKLWFGGSLCSFGDKHRPSDPLSCIWRTATIIGILVLSARFACLGNNPLRLSSRARR